MNKIVVFTLFMAIVLLSCKPSEKRIDKLKIAKEYYKALNVSNSSIMANLLGDSLIIIESEANYRETFSKKGYLMWVKWDSVFRPTYKVLEMEQENEIIKATISKIDKRISFLHKEPIVWNEILRFNDNKINRVERTNYKVFNAPKFVKNRDSLVNWIKENYLELDGFINEQTASGGIKYLKAMALYNAQK